MGLVDCSAGIIAEFNPLHRGHEALIRAARESGAAHIAVVMSGDFVQRGEPALLSKWERAETALRFICLKSSLKRRLFLRFRL